MNKISQTLVCLFLISGLHQADAQKGKAKKALPKNAQTDTQKLNSELAALKQRMTKIESTLKKTNSLLEQIAKNTKAKNKEKVIRRELSLEMNPLNQLLRALLDSKNISDQKRCLNYLAKIYADVVLKREGYPPIGMHELTRLGELASSNDNAVRKLATKVLLQYHSWRAREMGFQSGDFWKPIALGSEESELYDTMESQAMLDFSGESFEEVITEIQDRYKIEIKLDSKVPLKLPVEFTSHARKLGAALSDMLGTLGMAYVIDDDTILICYADDKKRSRRKPFKSRIA